MNRRFDRSRRAALAALGCVLLAPATATAQDPRAAMVQRAAREWLALVDRLEAAATWNLAGARFREAIPLSRWEEIVRGERAPRGAIVQRAVAATSFGDAPAGSPQGGTHALVQFRTAFANQLDGGEQVTLEPGADGVWRVIGYVIL